MSKVFLVQNRYVRDHDTGLVRPYYNMSRMGEWGEIVELLDWRLSPMASGPANQMLRAGLRDFSDNDYLIGIGAPAFIIAAGAIAASFNNGRVSVLHWDKTSGQYYPVKFITHSQKEIEDEHY